MRWSNGPRPALRPSGPSGHVPELDTFRTLAVLSVMCHHWLPATNIVNRIQNPTTHGVHLFFVLSGFLITRILLQSRQAVDAGITTIRGSLRQFYARRTLRIFPIYYLVLVVSAALGFPGVRAAFWWHATYMSNAYYFHRHEVFDGPSGVFWSLSVEEQFYLLWPLAILLVPRRGMIPFIAAVAVLGTACRDVDMFRWPAFNILTPACSNFLAMGALIAVADHPAYGSPSAGRRLRWVFGVAILALLGGEVALVGRRGLSYWSPSPAIRDINQTAMSMVYALIFARASRGFPRWVALPLRFPPLTYLGRISYGLYVYHLFVETALHRLATSHWGGDLGQPRAIALSAHFGVKFAVTVVVATISWFAIERPLNNLKRYFPYAKPPRPATAVDPVAVPV